MVALFIFITLITTVRSAESVEDHTDYYLPSLSIDPRNKFFACDEPTLRVKFNYNKIYMTCSQFEFNPFLRAVGTEEYFEKLYYVETEEEYRSCNATNGYPILTCNGTTSKQQKCDKEETTCSGFRLEQIVPFTHPKHVQYYPGRTYYFIATSYRTMSNIDNRVGGSCRKTDKKNEYRIRFKIYVCSIEEAKNGDCDPEKSLASYYRECINECTPWKENKNEISQRVNGTCYIKEHRNCTNIDTYVTTPQQRDIKIPCPEHQCQDWTNTRILTKINNTCTERQTRLCTNPFDLYIHEELQEVDSECPERQLCTNWVFDDEVIIRNVTCYFVRRRSCEELGTPYVEHENVLTECPLKVQPITSERSGETSKDETHLYIAIGASIGAFLIGLIVGISCCLYNNKKLSAGVDHSQVLGDNGYTNKGFSPAATELANGHVYDFIGNYVFGPDGRLGRLHSSDAPIYHTALSRSASLQYTDENVFTSPEAVHYYTERPRRPGKAKVNRNSSATSRTQLMRHFSDLSDARRPRITSYMSNVSTRPESMKSDVRPEIEVKRTEVDIIEEV